jgi:hypothetical protein
MPADKRRGLWHGCASLSQPFEGGHLRRPEDPRHGGMPPRRLKNLMMISYL